MKKWYKAGLMVLIVLSLFSLLDLNLPVSLS